MPPSLRERLPRLPERAGDLLERLGTGHRTLLHGAPPPTRADPPIRPKDARGRLAGDLRLENVVCSRGAAALSVEDDYDEAPQEGEARGPPPSPPLFEGSFAAR